MNITQFKTELAKLIKTAAGLSSDDVADELAEIAENLRRSEATDKRAGKFGEFQNDPVAYVIASHRP
jgi:hypothetical protein